jgi:hypothetical protein
MPTNTSGFLAKKLILFTLFVFYFFKLSYPVFGYSFIETFDDPSALINWEVYPDPGRTLCSNTWSVDEGRLVAEVTQFSCSINLVPNDSYWNNLGEDYIIEVDMWFVSGIDHNIGFRFIPRPTIRNDFYEIHFQSPNTIQSGVVTLPYNIPNKTDPYHLKIIVEGGTRTLYIDNHLAFTYTDPNITYPAGKVTLRAGTGVGSHVITYYDNLVITPTQNGPPPTNVSYFNQKDPEWADETYDFTNLTIGDLGCTLTSAVMVMNYHGVNKLPDGTPLTPLSLNNWLNDDPDGWWRQGFVSWGAIKRLTKEINSVFPDSPILDYTKIKGNDFTTIDNLLTNDQHPLIFEEISADSPSQYHFPLATGVNTSMQDYSILDPFYETRTNFLIPPDQLKSARHLYPTASNLSSIVIHADQTLNALITDSNQNMAGSDGNNTYENIPRSSYDQELPLFNPNDPSADTGDPFWETYIEDPDTGIYQLSLNSDQNGWYDLELYAYDHDANPAIFDKTVYISANDPLLYTLEYIQEGGNNFADLKIDNQSLQNLIWNMFDNDLISNRGHAQLLTRTLWLVDKAKNTLLHDYFVNLFKDQLQRHQKSIDHHAFDFLLEEAELL